MTVKLIPLASSISNPAESARISDDVAKRLKPVGIESSQTLTDEAESAEEAMGNSVLALMVTGGTEHLARAVSRSASSLMLLYHDSLNSLPAALEAASALNVPISRYDDLETISEYIAASRVHEMLNKTKFLYFGRPSPWLIYSTPSEEDMKRIGLKVERVDVEEFIDEVKREKVNDDEVKSVMKRSQAVGPDENDFRTSLKIEKAIRDELKETGSSSFSIRCFDLLEPLRGTACLALSRLNDEGYTAGCEGDAPAAISMMILSGLSGKPSFMGNVARVEGKNVTIAHCTSPTSILSDFKYMTHFESGMGVGIRGTFEEGQEMTVLRMNANLNTIRYGTGRVVSSEWRNDLCRTQVKISFDGDPSLILKQPIGNHYSLTPGNYSNELVFLARMIGAKLEKI
ncbi:MAG: L-arabinose isomerase family protein [Nitrososphaeria archaeon]